ncbi:PREDICTED: equilibrative nucleotide transporter 3 isoform X1 [Camelina sativa]|uniref:Equilibrative nucleotide transporter 3 isoform X1 n=1 Tax=Camelina sativa TaxID=90675 RepID=A0ABM0TUN3_CAMSA|nr:PREDICTED: equilibrative nucleotide transporter 3 isoform X1 [Camelina sativa]XP_010431741.1 PREDICTED: equilibrative nucleotide transporter 3 isoform X1 [Camelina sativa]
MGDTYENQPPEKLQGKYQAMVVCCILGIGSLVAWNSMLTIADYYYQVFPDYHPSRVLTLVYQPFALGTIVILTYHESKMNTRKRNLIGYTLFTISTFLLIVLDLATKGRGGVGPYIGLCAVVASFGLADATVQGGMIGDLSLMCPELVQSFMVGLAVAGALTSALRLTTKAAFEKSNDGLRKGAMIFLAISTFIELLCVLLYAYVFPKLPIVKYYRRKAASEGSKTVSADLAAAGIQNPSDLVTSENLSFLTFLLFKKYYSLLNSLKLLDSMQTDDDSKNQRLSNKELLLQNIDYAVNLFLIYVCTLSIFPGFLYENTGKHGLGDWYALVLVAMYNCWDLVGRYTPLLKWLKFENRKLITIAVLSRYLLIPAFYFTAKYGDQGYMIMLISVLGLTNGHLTVCIMTIAPKGYKGPEQNALGNLLVIFLLGGIFAGVALDWLWLIGKKDAF